MASSASELRRRTRSRTTGSDEVGAQPLISTKSQPQQAMARAEQRERGGLAARSVSASQLACRRGSQHDAPWKTCSVAAQVVRVR